jgi:hypothetical protein
LEGLVPNWCENKVTFAKDPSSELDSELLELVADAAARDCLLEFLSPIPNGLADSAPIGYFLRLEFWGTKWEVDEVDCSESRDASGALTSVTLSFISAWGPPLGAYQSAEHLGLGVKALYWEQGMGFCGGFEDGETIEREFNDEVADACNAEDRDEDYLVGVITRYLAS